MVDPVYHEPSLEEFRAYELGEIEELSGLDEKDGGGLDIPSNFVLFCGAALCLGVIGLVVAGVLVWRLRRRKQVPVAPETSSHPESRHRSPFIQAERRLAGLKSEYQSGRLDRAAYEAALQELMVQDEQGQYWALNGEDSAWYRYDGSAWVKGSRRAEHPVPAGHIPGERLARSSQMYLADLIGNV